MITLTVVIPTHNRAKLLNRLLTSLLVQDIPKTQYRIIVVDDCSKDNTQNMMHSFSKKNKTISYFRLKRNSGAGYARNKGISLVRSGYTLFIDDDCIAPPDLISNVRFIIEKYPFIRCLRGDILSLKNASIIDKYINRRLGCFYNKNMKKIHSDLYLVNGIPTCIAIYHRDLFDLKYRGESVRFLDLRCYEENELNHRLKEKNIKFYFSPSITCIHDPGNQDLRGLFVRKRRAGIAEFFINALHPEYKIRIPNNPYNTLLFILNTFHKPFTIIRETEIRYIIPFMFLTFWQQIAYNYGIYTAKVTYYKTKSLEKVNNLLKEQS